MKLDEEIDIHLDGQILVVSKDPRKTEEKIWDKFFEFKNRKYQLIECQSDMSFLMELINLAAQQGPIELNENTRYDQLTRQLATQAIEEYDALIAIIDPKWSMSTLLAIAAGKPDVEYSETEIDNLTQEIGRQHHAHGRIWGKRAGDDQQIRNLHFLMMAHYSLIESHFHNNTDLKQIAIVKPELYRLLHWFHEDTWSDRRFNSTYTDQEAEACFEYNH